MSETRAYLRVLVSRVRRALGQELVGAYVGGSFALGGYQPGRSDLDVAIVSGQELSDEQKSAVVDALRHESLGCPARGLELVVYTEARAGEGTADAAYELDLNTGRAMPFRASFSPEQAVRHWYPIDRSILRDHGITLYGPPPAELFAPLPREALLGLLSESVRWRELNEWARGDDAVLNACRALRFATHGAWSSKPDAGEWAREHLPDEAVVSEALVARSGGEQPDRQRVAAFLRRVGERLAEESLRS